MQEFCSRFAMKFQWKMEKMENEYNCLCIRLDFVTKADSDCLKLWAGVESEFLICGYYVIQQLDEVKWNWATGNPQSLWGKNNINWRQLRVRVMQVTVDAWLELT